MRARLARRLVVPLLVAVAALFFLLAWAAVSVAEGRVTAELEQRAARAAATVDGLALPREHRASILQAMARLSGLEYVLGATSTLDGAQVSDASNTTEAGGVSYRVLRRALARTGETLVVLAREDELSQRRRDVLLPIAIAGALGLLLALAIGLWVARLVGQPVRELADSVQGFAKGEFSGHFTARGPGEIGELQDAFVAMTNEIERQQEKVRESERFAALGRLAGGIAHELRNPLTAIRMAVETACDGPDDGRAEAKAVAVHEIDRLDRTLRELLDFVRPREPKIERVDVDELFRDVAALLGPQCAHLRVELVVPDETGVVVSADKDRLKQAVINLVLNGAQAQPRGGVVRLAARGTTVEVGDDGSGIPEDVKGTLFQPFVTTKAAGIGLGLAVVAQVANEHGASLEHETGPDGTTFRLTFSNTATR